MNLTLHARRRRLLRLQCLIVIVAVGCLAVAPAGAQQPPDKAQQDRMVQLYKSIQWQAGPIKGQLGGMAEIQVPAGYKFTGQAGAAKWMELNENPPDPTLLGIIVPADGADWFLSFSFRDVGYVKDDEKGKLDANAILEDIRQGTEAANQERRRRGWDEVHVVGWVQPPAYDKDTHNLTWAIKGRSGQSEGANYDIRILGRRGVMSVKMVADANQVMALAPTVKTLLGGFDFAAGNKYAEWRTGDKVAAYGLTGLITGGAAVAAAKTGLLGKLATLIAKGGKAIILGLLALGAGLWKFLTGRGKQEAAS